MIATLEYARDRFAHFNGLIFEGALPPVEIRLSRARGFLGKLEYRKVCGLFGRVKRCEGFVMKISTACDLPQDELDDVIIHEMIHYHIALSGVRDRSAHGPVFRAMMKDINARYGRHITISHRRTELQVQVPDRERYIIVSRFKTGELGVTVCAQTRLQSIRRMLPRCYDIESMTCYRSRDPFFARFPRSIKPRIYRAPQAELLSRLLGALDEI